MYFWPIVVVWSALYVIACYLMRDIRSASLYVSAAFIFSIFLLLRTIDALAKMFPASTFVATLQQQAALPKAVRVGLIAGALVLTAFVIQYLHW